MSSLADTYVRLAGDLWTGKVSDAGLFAAFSTSPANVKSFGLTVLQDAFATRDSVLVELGLYIGHRFGFTDGHLGVLIELARADWHAQHENVVDGLAKLRAPSAIDTLYMTALARLDYLDYDEAFALGVKCIWALGSIKAEEAVARLGDLLSSGNDILAENAVSQLSRIQDEGDEGESELLRGVARKALGAAVNPKSGAAP